MKSIFFLILFSFFSVQAAVGQPPKTVEPGTRCQVCGMFVAKFPHWLSVVVSADDAVHYFDGMKDLMVFVLNSRQYGVEPGSIKEIWVKDYYSLAWIDARVAFFVVGSDVYGPMGHEFIPFATEKAAQNFKMDHGATAVVPFSKITTKQVEAMRSGQKMR